MGKTFKTNKARELHHREVPHYTQGFQETETFFREINRSATRHGNKRKAVATRKVIKRRQERRKLNRVDDDSSSV